MKTLQLAGAAALCGALLLTACAKKTDESTSTSTTTDTTQAANATPAADAAPTAAPAATSTTASTSISTSSTTASGNGASGQDIEIPVYPGATSGANEGMSVSGNGTSVAMKVYSTKDDSKRVAEWYKDHLPAGWQNSVISAAGKTVGTFVAEHKDGDQSVIVAPQDDGTTRIQVTTKHGK